VFATAGECIALVRTGRASPAEIVEESLRRIEAWQPVTNAFSQLRPEASLAEARARADRLARREVPGPLEGVPVAIKDLFDVEGWETTGCCAAYRGRVARRDAEAVRLLREAGAVVVGKTNQHELAAGATNLVSACGPTRNPWDPGRITGGSSGGSGAAVAARAVPLALGTDTGGSVRIPASMCGITGLKPTHGRVSLDGVMPLAPSLDTVGPMAATAEDTALAFAVLAGEGERFVADARGPADAMTVGVVAEDLAGTVRQDVIGAVRDIGDGLRGIGGSVDAPAIAYDPEDWDRVGWREFFEVHGRLLEGRAELGGSTRGSLERGRDLPAGELREARERVARLRAELLRRFDSVDVLIMPSTPFPALRADELQVDIGGTVVDARRGAVSVLTRPINLAGFPALAVPSGFSAEGLPLGAQIVGPPGSEARLLRVGRAWQAGSGHHRRQPSMPKESGPERLRG
jgi:aspartyl-tRNA(Asn)/glutamyl-tRNA(Gln) amidotransferase subunit A